MNIIIIQNGLKDNINNWYKALNEAAYKIKEIDIQNHFNTLMVKFLQNSYFKT